AAMARTEILTLRCDLFLAIGSSLVVWPAAGFPMLAKRNGARLVIVNRETTEFDDLADLVIHDDIGTVLAPFVVGRARILRGLYSTQARARSLVVFRASRALFPQNPARKPPTACSGQQVLHVVDSRRKLHTGPPFCALLMQGQCYVRNTGDSWKRP